MHLQEILKDSLSHRAPEARRVILSAMVDEIFENGALVGEGPPKEPQEKKAVDPLAQRVRSFRVFRLRWRRLLPTIALAGAEIAAGELLTPAVHSALALAVAGTKAAVDVLVKAFEVAEAPLSELEAEVVFSLYSPTGNTPMKVSDLVKLRGLAAWSSKQHEVVDALQKLERFDIVHQDPPGEWLLIEDVKIRFESE